MYKDKSKLINALLAIWQLPQILLGIICLCIFRNKEEYTNPYNHITVWKISSKGLFGNACFSTGPIIVVCSKDVSENTLRHETGHSKQSIYLGWLFHIIISIPSVCRFWYRRIFNKSQEWYHSGYPENWADNLGGVGKDIPKEKMITEDVEKKEING